MIMTVTQVTKAKKSRVVETFQRTAGTNEVINLRLPAGECIWIDTPLGLVRVSAIMTGQVNIESYSDDKGLKFRKV